MIGKPKYNLGDVVTFDIYYNGQIHTLTGRIDIIDANGTFEQNEEVSYDIMVDKSDYRSTPCLYKHIRESALR